MQKIFKKKSCGELSHIPVLLKESLELLSLSPGKIIVDCTLGGGGHSGEIIKAILPGGRLIAIDQDLAAIEACKELAGRYLPHMTVHRGNFKDLEHILGSCGMEGADGFLFDLGVSSFQLDEKKRGFSFMGDDPLDMRMSKDMCETAADLVNSLPEEELARIIYEYGEERKSRRIARVIVQEREKERILTTGRLVSIIKKVIPHRKGKIHPATKTFMALRIFLNKELEVLEKGLLSAFKFLKPGGRLVVISFHSLEDRIVKRFFNYLKKKCRCPKNLMLCACEGRPLAEVITRKPLSPGEEEKIINPRSRSARLRAIEKI